MVEEGARKLKGMEAEDPCGQVCGILRHAKLPQDNLTKEQRKALKELRQIDLKMTRTSGQNIGKKLFL